MKPVLALIFLDVAPEIGTAGIAAGIGFFLAFAAIAYIAFRLMRRTVRIALRLTIAALILLVAVVGSILIFWRGGSAERPVRPRPPAPSRSR